MKKGVIMEINEQYVTMLTPQGEFLRARKLNRSYKLGEEIDFFPVEQTAKKNRTYSILSIFSFLKVKGTFAAALAMLLAVVSFVPFYTEDQVYAYMSIDINPSIELGVNEELQVIEVNAYNSDGKAVVSQLSDWKNSPLNKVTDSIIEEIEKLGYFNENKEIVVTTVVTESHDKKIDKEIEKELTVIEEKVATEKVAVTVVEATTEERTEAKKEGLSVGKFKQEQSMKVDSKEKEKNNSNSNKEKASDKNNVDDKSPKDQGKGLENPNKQKEPGNNPGKGNKPENPGKTTKPDNNGKRKNKDEVTKSSNNPGKINNKNLSSTQQNDNRQKGIPSNIKEKINDKKEHKQKEKQEKQKDKKNNNE